MKFKKTSYAGTTEILKYKDFDAIPVMVESDGIAANADGKKIVAAGTIVGGNTKPVLSNRQEPVVKKNTQATYDTITLVPDGDNNDVKVTAKASGVSGLSIELVDPAGNNQALAVSIAGSKITVSLATDGVGAITSTADDIIAAINADPDISERVLAEDGAGSDGSGVVMAIAETPLAGGAAGTGSAAEGVLLYDVDVTDGDHPGSMVIRGDINLDKIPEAPCADAVLALKGRIVFMK